MISKSSLICLAIFLAILAVMCLVGAIACYIEGNARSPQDIGIGKLTGLDQGGILGCAVGFTIGFIGFGTFAGIACDRVLERTKQEKEQKKYQLEQNQQQSNNRVSN